MKSSVIKIISKISLRYFYSQKIVIYINFPNLNCVSKVVWKIRFFPNLSGLLLKISLQISEKLYSSLLLTMEVFTKLFTSNSTLDPPANMHFPSTAEFKKCQQLNFVKELCYWISSYLARFCQASSTLVFILTIRQLRLYYLCPERIQNYGPR